MNLHRVVAKAMTAAPADARIRVTLTRVVPGTVEPITDVDVGATSDAQTVAALLVTLRPEYLAGGVIRQRGRGLLIAARSVAWPPAAGHVATWDTDTDTVVSAKALPNATSPAAYELELVR